MPEHLQSLKQIFNYTHDAADEDELGEEFDKLILDKITETKTRKIRNTRKLYLYVASGVAASIIVIIGLFVTFDSYLKPITETEIAYNKTKDALIYLSAKFNSGLEPASSLTEFDNGVEELNKIKSFDDGVEVVKKRISFK